MKLPPALVPIVDVLSAMLETDTLPHALLLEGASEALRKDAAIALARALLCEPDTQDETISLFGEEENTISSALPCEECPHCKKSAQGIHPDLFVLEGSGGTRSFHIDLIRGMRQSAYVLPNEAERKVYVLLGTHTMTVEAQNALLKLLEEPPDYVRIILTAPNRRQLLPTVISRATALSLGELSNENMDEEREALVTGTAQSLAAALLAPKTPAGFSLFTLLEATAPLEGNKDLMRDTLPALKFALHSAVAKNPSVATRALQCIDGLEALEFALERNANMNLLITQLAYLGVK